MSASTCSGFNASDPKYKACGKCSARCGKCPPLTISCSNIKLKRSLVEEEALMKLPSVFFNRKKKQNALAYGEVDWDNVLDLFTTTANKVPPSCNIFVEYVHYDIYQASNNTTNSIVTFVKKLQEWMQTKTQDAFVYLVPKLRDWNLLTTLDAGNDWSSEEFNVDFSVPGFVPSYDVIMSNKSGAPDLVQQLYQLFAALREYITFHAGFFSKNLGDCASGMYFPWAASELHALLAGYDDVFTSNPFRETDSPGVLAGGWRTSTLDAPYPTAEFGCVAFAQAKQAWSDAVFGIQLDHLNGDFSRLCTMMVCMRPPKDAVVTVGDAAGGHTVTIFDLLYGTDSKYQLKVHLFDFALHAPAHAVPWGTSIAPNNAAMIDTKCGIAKAVVPPKPTISNLLQPDNFHPTLPFARHLAYAYGATDTDKGDKADGTCKGIDNSTLGCSNPFMSNRSVYPPDGSYAAEVILSSEDQAMAGIQNFAASAANKGLLGPDFHDRDADKTDDAVTFTIRDGDGSFSTAAKISTFCFVSVSFPASLNFSGPPISALTPIPVSSA